MVINCCLWPKWQLRDYNSWKSLTRISNCTWRSAWSAKLGTTATIHLKRRYWNGTLVMYLKEKQWECILLNHTANKPRGGSVKRLARGAGGKGANSIPQLRKKSIAWHPARSTKYFRRTAASWNCYPDWRAEYRQTDIRSQCAPSVSLSRTAATTTAALSRVRRVPRCWQKAEWIPRMWHLATDFGNLAWDKLFQTPRFLMHLSPRRRRRSRPLVHSATASSLGYYMYLSMRATVRPIG